MREAFPDMPEKDRLKNANKLLEKPAIKNEVGRLIEQVMNSDVARAPALLLRQCEFILSLDPLDFYYPDWTAKDLDQIDPDKRCLISDINITVNNKTGESRITYKLMQKEKANDRLGDIVALLTRTRAAMGNDFEEGTEDILKKREEIFKMVDDFPEVKADPVIAPQKRGRGRPKKVEQENSESEQ
jgi:hypothetical protein